MEASGVDVFLDHFVEPGFVDGDAALEERLDFLFVDVNACHVNAHLGEACA